MTQPATAPPMTDGLGPLGELDEPSLLKEEDVPLAPLLEAAVEGAPVARSCVGVDEGAGDSAGAWDGVGEANDDGDGGGVVLVTAVLPPGEPEAEPAVADADSRALVLALAKPLGAKERDGDAPAVAAPLGEDAWLCDVEADGNAEALEDAETDNEPVRVRPVETVCVGVGESEGVDEAVAACVDESDPDGVAACERDWDKDTERDGEAVGVSVGDAVPVLDGVGEWERDGEAVSVPVSDAVAACDCV